MLFLLSPAKTLNYEIPLADVAATEPPFVPQAADSSASTPMFRRDAPPISR